MTKGINQYSYTDYANGNGTKVYLSLQVFASGTRFNGRFAVSEGKNQSSSALGSRRVTGSYNFSGFKSSSSVVSVVDVAANNSAGRWSSPGREFFLSRNHRERVLGNKVFGSKPSHVDGLERVMNFDSRTTENYFGLNHDCPQNRSNRKGICNSYETGKDVANSKVRNSSEDANEGNYCQIDPVTAGSKNVSVSHDGQTIADCKRVSPFSATKEGI